MSVRGILFDWTGTLAYQDRAARQDPVLAICAELTRSQQLIPPDDIRSAVRELLEQFGDDIALGDLVRQACARAGATLAPGAEHQLSLAFAKAMLAGQELYDDARAILSSLKYRGYTVAIVSNLIVPGEMLQDHLVGLGAGGYVAGVATSGDTGHAKPHPAPFLRALELLHLDPADALVVGDSLDTDVAGARNAGLDAILVARRGLPAHAGVPVIQRLTGLNDILGEGAIGREP